MPADARSLLRVAAAERARSSAGGIADPWASYHPTTGALRCAACGYMVIKHEALWSAHAASKSHRSNAAREKAEREEKERKEAEKKARKEGKRKAVDGDADAVEKRQDTKRARTEEEGVKGAAALPLQSQTNEPVDEDWELFRRTVLDAESDSQAPQAAAAPSYANATISAEPVLRADASREGGAHGDAGEQQQEETQEESAEEKRARLEQEEREEIYARFEEEQRLQDEADER